MRKLVAIALIALPGCASLDLGQWPWEEPKMSAQKEREDSQKAWDLWALEYDAISKQRAEEAEKEAEGEAEEEARAAYQEELKKHREAAAATAAAEKERIEAPARAKAHLEAKAAARGYKLTEFSDFYLDYKTIPLGSKRAVRGLYQVFGEFETLTMTPSTNPFDGWPRVALLTDTAPRDVRALLLTPSCRIALCQRAFLFLGRTVNCTITRRGQNRDNVCFAIDEMW